MRLGEPSHPSPSFSPTGDLAERLARRSPKRIVDPEVPRAAVALVLRPHPEDLELLLIQRAERSGDPWSGHIGLPGGRSSPDDASLIDTVYRETQEEVGVRLATQGRLLGSLDDLPAMARGRRIPLIITPFVFELLGQVELATAPEEVAEAFWTPLSELQRPDTQSTHPFAVGGQSVQLPAIRIGRHVLWGLTLRMVRALFDVFGAPLGSSR